MNVLSAMLNKAAKHGIFKFHPKCRRISLTYLSFTYDLLVFCHGSLESVLGVQCTLERFYDLSGLKLNTLKTELFACGLSGSTLDQIQSVTGFRVAQLPVRYLGVPLVTQKLTSKDCAALLGRIKDKLSQWSRQKLSFRGRLQLIKTVLHIIFNYWSRQLILPKGIVRDIERLCMRFFWKGNDSPTRGARVGWNQICSLKSEGGLGLRDLSLWSKACCLLLIKNILANEGSIWIAWIKEYCFKNVSFWEAICKDHFSLIIKKLLNLREVARTLFLPSTDWRLISSKWIWGNIRISRENVNWHKIIWFPAHIPKCSLISWMDIPNRLPTKDRLIRFGLEMDNSCIMCGNGLETRDHLFANCSFVLYLG
ncbi:uncharacterized protein LOC120120557 [Hibiscus syriacus]|uniref:uncharacterized protein LOC120120557 n=1 Tax=Hibiscus syriacus TaxID=106335 RepID=UPI0019249052|nr:uncharacterized protein LOC120120557 [Hibiscus syriacus]